MPEVSVDFHHRMAPAAEISIEMHPGMDGRGLARGTAPDIRRETMAEPPAIWLVTGIMAAGKSTVAAHLARRFPCAAHVPGDAFREMVVSGRADMTPDPSAEALGQLRLRYDQALAAADAFVEASITAVIDDIVIGPELERWVTRVRRPFHLVVLCPRPDAVAAREADRAKTGYTAFAVAELDAVLRNETPRIGLWIDSSDLTPDETVEIVLRQHEKSRISR
jgi:cytidylate kinase